MTTAPATPPLSTSGASAIDVAWMCAHTAGALALSRFRGEQRIDVKGPRNIVTETDVEAERRVIEVLAAEYPDHKILSEETAYDTDASTGWTWVVDPIDGTKNYAIGIPFWCTNVALCCDGEPVVGLTYDAVHGEGFWAIAGQGAYCNEERIHVSTKDDVLSSVISLDLGYDDALGSRQLELMQRIFPNVQGIRIPGSAALGMAYAACGRVDLYAPDGGAVGRRAGHPARARGGRRGDGT
jgi:myo-inositol-1(or 4)-monophosphatase